MTFDSLNRYFLIRDQITINRNSFTQEDQRVSTLFKTLWEKSRKKFVLKIESLYYLPSLPGQSARRSYRTEEKSGGAGGQHLSYCIPYPCQWYRERKKDWGLGGYSAVHPGEKITCSQGLFHTFLSLEGRAGNYSIQYFILQRYLYSNLLAWNGYSENR